MKKESSFTKNAESYYDMIADSYFKLYKKEQLEKAEAIKKRLFTVFPELKEDSRKKRLLDLGSGPCFARWPFIAYAVDPSKEMLRLAAKANKELIKAKKLKLIRAKAEKMPFKSSFFDIVISITAMQNFSSISKAIREIRRIGKNAFAFSFLKASKKAEMIRRAIKNSFNLAYEEEQEKDIIMFCRRKKEQKKRLLLHACCGPCATETIKRLSQKFNLTMFFYNPNIHPKKEYLKRKEAAKKLAKLTNTKIVIPGYDAKSWFSYIKGYEKEKESSDSKRCFLCYELRLKKTAEYAESNSYDFFTTTLTISPHKSAYIINSIGKKLSTKSLKFLELDLKKENGFKKSVELSKELCLYRQSYCGCIFSKLEKEKRERERENKREQESRLQSLARKKIKDNIN